MKRRMLGVFSAFSFVTEMRLGIFYAFFSLYLKERIEATYTQVGFMITLMFVVNALFQALWGWTSDRIAKRKHFLIIGEGIPGIVFLFIPKITNITTFIFVMTAIQVVWSMSGPAWKALIAELSAPEKRGEIMGKITMFGGIGSIIGIYVVGELISEVGYESLFYFSSLCMMVASLTGTLITEPERLKPNNQKFLSTEQLRILTTEYRHIAVFNILVLFFLFTLSLVENFIPLYVRSLGATIKQVSYVSIVRDGVVTILMIPAGIMTDKVGKVKMLQVSLLFSACAVLLFGLAPTWWWLLPAALVEGIGWSGYVVSSFAVLSSLAPREMRGTYMGLYNMVMATARIGPFVAGSIADRFGLKALFFGAFTLCCIVVIYFINWLKENSEKINQSHN